jgi:hypothetical protein
MPTARLRIPFTSCRNPSSRSDEDRHLLALHGFHVASIHLEETTTFHNESLNLARSRARREILGQTRIFGDFFEEQGGAPSMIRTCDLLVRSLELF